MQNMKELPSGLIDPVIGPIDDAVTDKDQAAKSYKKTPTAY